MSCFTYWGTPGKRGQVFNLYQQGKQIAYGKRADGKPICAIIAGSYYLHDESYMDQLSNRHWRGLLVMNEVQDGHFDEMFLSIEYLQRKYGKE